MVENINGPQLVNPNRPKTFREFCEEAGGTEVKLYYKRLELTKKPIEEWTDDDAHLAMACTFQWCQWMQLVRNGGDL